MRPGCDRPAEVRLSYDTVSCQVWLDPILDRPGPVQEICEFHALRLTVPRGWLLCERRVPNPALFVPADAPEKIVPSSVPGDASTSVPSDASTDNDRSSSTGPLTVPLTVGAPSPRVGRRTTHKDAVQLKRRHPSETASELFPDELAQPVEPAQPVALVDPLTPAVPTESGGRVAPLGPAERPSALEDGADAPAGASAPGDPDSDAADAPAGASIPADAADPADPTSVDANAPADAAGGDAPEGHTAEDGAADSARAADTEAADTEEDKAGKDALKPTSPLLARAFAQTGPQRSVLSDDLRVPDQERRKRNSR